MATAESSVARGRRDFAALRKDFPALHQLVHGKPLAYLDNAASSQSPIAVHEAMAAQERLHHSNVHRGVHQLSERSTAAFEGARQKVQRFVNAASSTEIVFTRGTTESINLVAASYGQRLRAGDEVLITWLEHHSNIVPWQLLCERTGARLVVAPIRDDGSLDIEGFERRLNERTKIVAFAHVSNALGTLNPVASLTAKAHAVGAVVLVDGAQAVPHLRVDVQALGCDFYAFSGHKMFGPTGTGVLYGKRALLETMPPYQGGGDMILTVSFEGSTYNALPYKFEAGTPNITGVVGLGAAVDYLEAIDFAALAQHEHALLEHATQRVLGEVPGVRVIGTAADKASVLSFVVDGIHAHDLGTIVDSEGVAIRTGHHCAMPVMERFGVAATARASFAFYNNRDDIDRLIVGLKKAVEISVDELQELYREVILDHNRNPRNFGELADATRVVAGVNPLCGDKMTLYVKVGDGKIQDIRFRGTGCAISVASSSLMTERVKGAPVAAALELFDKIHELLTAPHDHEPPADLEKLAALGGVREYPSRVKCASLAWHALKSAVADDTAGKVTTE